MARVLRPGGHAVIEVGEVVHDRRVLRLDEVIVDLAVRNPKSEIPLAVVEVLIHSQKFTKLANCFNVTNNRKGTNTHRLVVLRRVD